MRYTSQDRFIDLKWPKTELCLAVQGKKLLRNVEPLKKCTNSSSYLHNETLAFVWTIGKLTILIQRGMREDRKRAYVTYIARTAAGSPRVKW